MRLVRAAFLFLQQANILIDRDGCVRLADFGLANTAQLTGSDYGDIFTHGGATRWQAPELLDPDRFGSWTDLPTYQSDMYAFGSVCLEVLSLDHLGVLDADLIAQLYTGQSPYCDLSDVQVYSLVLTGGRPSRPLMKDGVAMSDAFWELANWCWSDSPSSRPTVDDCLASILTATGGVMSPHLGEPDAPPTPSVRSTTLEQMLVLLRLEGVERMSTAAALTGGRSSDIFIGKYRGHRVALKRIRMFLSSENERKVYEVR